jgi:capsular exopolysaccharide synthesis family protein
MRKPRVHKLFGISNKKGLADMLRKEHNYVDYIQRVEDLNLDVLTAGKIPTNPSELLHSNAMKNLITVLKEEYDYIFLDTPPVTPVTDATILSGYIDGVILVVASGAVDIDLTKRAVQSMTKVGANILGVVINKLKVENAKQYQTYYYYQSKEVKEEDENENG